MPAYNKLDAQLQALGYTCLSPDTLTRRYSRGDWTLCVEYLHSPPRGARDTRTPRSVTITHTTYRFDESVGGVANYLVRPSRSQYATQMCRPLWEIAAGPDRDPERGRRERSMRERILAVAHDPGLALWLAAAELHRRAERRAAHEAAVNAPLPITIPTADYRKLALLLNKAARELRDANGTTDLPAVYERARQALDAIGETITSVDTAEEMTA